ncbi:MAG: hypothetical protein FWE42_08740 [Defluviitaleaceae bacterium]|nr:hypothetical protein [Defluviitaleaceae bacterium]
MDENLKKAVSIFNILGWEGANSENVMDLPLGTTEQKKTALEGLKAGAWSEYITITEGNSTRGRSNPYFTFEFARLLAVFAIRVGVTARRARDIVNLHYADKEMLFKVIEARGKKYASEFITQNRFIPFADEKSETGTIAFIMRLMDDLDLEIPQNLDYIDCWTSLATAAMGIFRRYDRNNKSMPSPSLIEKRFVEHIDAGLAINAPATSGFAAVVAAGVKHGFLPREGALERCLSALDAAVRPGDRAAWINALDSLEIKDEELLARIQSLIPLLSLGDATVIKRLAPPLITQAPDGLLTEVLLGAFSAPTKKAKKLLLKTALTRNAPPSAEDISPWISIFAGDADKTIAAQAAKLAEKWGIGVETFVEEEAGVVGLWQETPQVWQVPDFEIGEVSPEALTELLVKVSARSNDAAVHDLLTEQFYALINAVARQSPEDARTSLRGISKNSWSMREILCWVQETESYGADENITKNGRQYRIRSPLYARDYVIAKNFGKLPCLLSTPSKVDLTITAADLAARLESYAKENIKAQEGDLYLAITRLDLKTVTPEARAALEKLNVPVQLQNGEDMSLTAGQAILHYLDNPLAEPGLEVAYTYWRGKYLDNVSKSLGAFPERLDQKAFGNYLSDFSSTFPTFGDAALRVGLDGYSDHEKLPRLPQAARRAAPLPPKASMDLLASLGYAKMQAAEEVLMAITKAWERGLLRPGVADVKYLGSPKSPPSNLVALATGLDTIARSGLLSVVWPVLDNIVGASLAAPRLLPGTAEICELALALLP